MPKKFLNRYMWMHVPGAEGKWSKPAQVVPEVKDGIARGQDVVSGSPG